MTKLRPLLALALTSSLLLPVPVAAQDQDQPAEAPTTAPTLDDADTRLTELEAIVPEFFAGLPLRENMQSALGEELTSRMDEAERAVFESMLEANGKTIADYAAANIPVRIDESTVIVLQPHRVSGVEAADTVEAWIDILALNTERPDIGQVVIAGQEVSRISDSARPDFPLLHVFPAGDVVWMVVAGDEAVLEEAVRTLTAAAVTPEVDG